MNTTFLRAMFPGLLLALSGACGGAKDAASPASGGSGGSGASGGSGGVNPGPVAPLPVPEGPGELPKPSGTEANLRVLPWAGFTAAVSYSFDDAQPSQLEHWEALKATGVRMTFYIQSSNDWIANFDAVWQEAVSLGHELGNHTVHHCRAAEVGTPACMNGLPTVDAEIDQCSDYIVNVAGQAGVWTSAHPFGDGGWMQPASKRFFLARGVNTGMIAPGDSSVVMNLPAIAHQGDPTVPGGDPVSVFDTDTDNAVASGRWFIHLFHSILPTSNNWYAGESIEAITGSIEYAKGLGAVWLDTVANVGAYWLGQKTLEAVTPVTTDGTTTWTWTLPPHFPGGRSLRVVVDGGTLSQGGEPLAWDGHGYYEVALDAGKLTWSP